MKNQLCFKVAAYVRLSREDGDKAESDSIGNQLKLIETEVRNDEALMLIDTYIDDGFTGTHFQRPGFQRMLSDIENGKINCVIVKDLSRFGRDYIDTGKYLERYFPEKGVRFISIMDNIDSMKQTYDMLLPIKNIFNEQYARDISRKIHASVTTRQKAGEFIGAFASYGYQKDPHNKNKLIVDEYAADVVRRVFQLYIAGYGKLRIAGILNEEGIVCPSEYKRMNGDNYKNCNRLSSTSYWTYSTINRMLQNEIYIGNMVQGKSVQHMRGRAEPKSREEWIVVPDTHEAIIEKDTWNKVQGLLKRRTRNLDLNTNKGIFTGFLKCGDCGRALVRRKSWSRAGSQTEEKYNYYCGTYVRSGRKYCTPHSIPHSVLEKIILDDLETIIQSIDNLKTLIAEQKIHANDVNVQMLEKEKRKIAVELERNRKLKKGVYEDYKEGFLEQEEYIAYRQDYVKAETMLEKQMEALIKRQEKGAVVDVFDSDWVKRLMELKAVETLDRSIVVEMIHEIVVCQNNKIKITYHFSNELENLFHEIYSQKDE